MLSLGCELVQVTKDLGAEFWIGVAQWVRARGFTGPLTYSANWGYADDAEYNRLKALWPHLDYIGVDAYFPLVPLNYNGPLDVDTLTAAWHRRGIEQDWCPRIDDDLLRLSHEANKPLLFTEIGYGNHRHAPEAPGEDAPPDAVRDDDLQTRLTAAFHRRWDHEDALAGFFWWEAQLPQDRIETPSHNLIDRPIEQSVFRAGGGAESAVIEAIAESGVRVPPRHIGRDDRPHGPDYPIESVPTISPDVFRDQLVRRHSPALGQADAIDYYRAIMNTGINPAIALAFFGKESQFGTDSQIVDAGGINWGNLRLPPSGRLGRALGTVKTRDFGLFRTYRSYMDSLLDWCDLLQAPLYKGKTILGVLKIYAPDSDFNDPNGYAGTVKSWVRMWDEQSGDFDIPGDGGTATGPGYALQSAPTVTPDAFTAALTDGHSPALGEVPAAAYYNLIVANGIDPAIALAFFGQETSYGTSAGSTDQRNWGNLWDAQANARQIYPSWIAGLRDWCARIQGPAYTHAGPPTLDVIVPIYRGPNAHNPDNATYLTQLQARVDSLRAAGPLGGAESGIVNLGDESGVESGFVSSQIPAIAFKPANARNFHVERRGQPIVAIVNHVMIGTLQSTTDWFQNKNQPENQLVSSNYGIGKGGEIVRYVKDEDGAHANGIIRNPNTGVVPWINWAATNHVNPNDMTISIEWEGTHHNGKSGQVDFEGKKLDVDYVRGSLNDGDYWVPTEAQYQAGLALIRYLCAEHNISRDRVHICRHSDVDSVTKWFCPGAGFPMQRLIDDLRETGYFLAGQPSISQASFTQTLVDAHSPVLQEADGVDYYRLCLANGVDPAIALAFFGQETGYGSQAGAGDNKNWGNLWDHGAGHIGQYPTWQAGLDSWCKTLQRDPYTNGGAPTIASITPIHRGTDQPDNAQYIAQVQARVDALRAASH